MVAGRSSDVLARYRRESAAGGGSERIEKQHAAGKLTARERLAVLLDEGSFVEIGGFRAARPVIGGKPYTTYVGDGVVTGFGKINGRTVCVSSEDFTVNGGTLGETHSRKICDALGAALDVQVPFIMLNDGGGARIQESVVSLAGYSEIFLKNTIASGSIPQISAVMGTCAGGACYLSALCDFVFMVNKTSKMFITGPAAVKLSTGESVDVNELGGSDVHQTISGTAHFVFEDDTTCLKSIRALLGYLPQNSEEKPPALSCTLQDRSDEINDIVSDDLKRPYDVLAVIDKIVDQGSFFEVQKRFAPNAVIGLSRIAGNVVGVIANQPMKLAGVLDIDVSDKIARFIRFCDCFSIPLLTLVDTPGFLPGRQQEHAGIIRHGAKILYAFSEATVPKVSVVMRKAYGGAYIAMNSKRMAADYVISWPMAEIAVMSAEGGVEIAYRRELASAPCPGRLRAELIKHYKRQFLNPYYAAKNGLIDEVIYPEETRSRIIRAFDFLSTKDRSGSFSSGRRHGNMPF